VHVLSPYDRAAARKRSKLLHTCGSLGRACSVQADQDRAWVRVTSGRAAQEAGARDEDAGAWGAPGPGQAQALWGTVAEADLLASSHERKFLAFQLFTRLLPSLTWAPRPRPGRRPAAVLWHPRCSPRLPASADVVRSVAPALRRRRGILPEVLRPTIPRRASQRRRPRACKRAPAEQAPDLPQLP